MNASCRTPLNEKILLLNPVNLRGDYLKVNDLQPKNNIQDYEYEPIKSKISENNISVNDVFKKASYPDITTQINSLSDDEIYTIIYDELENKTYEKGLWIKLYAESDGDENKTKVLYVKKRFEKLSNKVTDSNITPKTQNTVDDFSRSLKKNLNNESDDYFPFNKFTVIDTVKEFEVSRELAKKILTLNIRKVEDKFLYKHLSFKTLEEAFDYAKSDPQKKN